MTIKTTIKIRGIEFSFDKQCPKCKKMRTVDMFIDKQGSIYKTCEICRAKR